ncbi:hypothetical protein [Duganella caerulea]
MSPRLSSKTSAPLLLISCAPRFRLACAAMTPVPLLAIWAAPMLTVSP